MVDCLPPPPFWRTRYYAEIVVTKPGRQIDPADILATLPAPARRVVQPDGRVRHWRRHLPTPPGASRMMAVPLVEVTCHRPLPPSSSWSVVAMAVLSRETGGRYYLIPAPNHTAPGANTPACKHIW